VRVAVDGREAVLEVADQGPGMSAEQAAHVFDRFYRGDSARLDGGSGLGLFIVARLAHTFGGRVSVDTDLGRGSTFQVVLPLYDAGRLGAEGGSDRREKRENHRRAERENEPGAGRGDERGAEREGADARID
jgi:hypothetical protein